jgi:hypothetical protein
MKGKTMKIDGREASFEQDVLQSPVPVMLYFFMPS